jgi:hypothetical protein
MGIPKNKSIIRVKNLLTEKMVLGTTFHHASTTNPPPKRHVFRRIFPKPPAKRHNLVQKKILKTRALPGSAQARPL